MSLVLLFVQRTRTKFVDDHTHGPKCVFLSEEMNDNVLDYIISKVMIVYVDPNVFPSMQKLVKMRTTQVLLLALALLMVASGVVTAASMDGIAKFNYRCAATLIPSPKPCNNDTCDMACFDLIKVPKQGKCDVVGCKCMICEDQPPLQRING